MRVPRAGVVAVGWLACAAALAGLGVGSGAGFAGCGRTSELEGELDAGAAGGARDLRPARDGDDAAAPDLACATCGGRCTDLLGDASNCGACGRACGGMQACRAGACVGPDDRQLAIDLIRLPVRAGDFAIDLDGDGRPDNALGAWAAALTRATVVDDAVDTEVNLGLLMGDVVVLLELPQAARPDRPVAVLQGLPMATPDFSGQGFFSVDPDQPAALLPGGTWQGKAYVFVAAAGTPPPVTPLTIPRRTGHKLILRLAIQQLQLQLTGSGLKGEIHGSIRRAAVVDELIPELAREIENLATVDSRTPPATRIALLATYDIGDGHGGACTGGDGVTGRPADRHVAACEVLAAPSTAELLAADLHVYDAQGRFAPGQPASPGVNDAISFGVAFAAAPGTFF